MKHKNSIHSYYFTYMLVVLLVSIVLISILQFAMSINYFSREKEKKLENQVIVFSNQIKKDIDITLADLENMAGYLSYVNNNKVVLLNEDGIVTVSFDSAFISVGSQFSKKALEKAQEGVFSEYSTLDNTFARKNFVAGNRIENETSGKEYYLFIIADADQMQNYLRGNVARIIISTVIVLGLASILNFIILKKTLKPVQIINDAADEFAAGRYGSRIQVEGDDEFSHLALAFNNMADLLQSIDESRQTFMGNFAHELRTPMTSIKGFVDGMLDGTIPENQQQKYLKIVSEEVGRLSRLIQRMLDISKLESGEYDFKNSIFNIYDPIIAVILGAEQRIESKNIEIKWEEDVGTELVNADEDFIQEVLFNLLDNAIKFTNDGGEIVFSVKQIDTQVQVSITNTGEGISPKDIQHIFERFYKEDESRGRNKNGTGLGLHIVRLLVSGMGGRIWAESVEGEWFKISFVLPAAPKIEK